MGNESSDSVWMAILEIIAYKRTESTINAPEFDDGGFITDIEESRQM